MSRTSLRLRHQRRIAAGGGCVDRHRLLGAKPQQIMRTAGLGSGSGQATAPKRLNADNGTDHVAVDVDVAGCKAGRYPLNNVVDPRVNSESQAKAAGFERGHDIPELLRPIANDVKDRPEDFFAKSVKSLQLEDMRGNESAPFGRNPGVVQLHGRFGRSD